MPNLVSFEWEDNVEKIRMREVADNQDVWSVLAANTAVEKVIIEEVDSRTAWDILSNLVIFEYNMWLCLWDADTWDAGSSLPRDCSRLVAMLSERCPRLQELYLQLTPDLEPPNLGDSLFTTQWRDLRAVRLEGIASTPAAVVSFFSTHPSLRRVRFDEWFGCCAFPDDFDDFYWDSPIALPLALPPGILPNLESLHCVPIHAIDIIQSILSKSIGSTDPTLSISVDVELRTEDHEIAALEEVIFFMKGLPQLSLWKTAKT
ncbi:hypothetical protein FA95DRAFT_1611664 [Auriscalpium vulgare]|uniref:Uncharacterized protein n=1 Tax=Auriscalpium vulgare TaxID=40419 RepID=A0ACB8R8Z3_9AGAM|nr:hypothetical protein FA95DRAFT_1611664 [Auriscalpium vulgare]